MMNKLFKSFTTQTKACLRHKPKIHFIGKRDPKDATKGLFDHETPHEGSETTHYQRPENLWEISPEAKKTPYFTTYRRQPISAEEIEAINSGGAIVGDYKKVKPIKLDPSSTGH